MWPQDLELGSLEQLELLLQASIPSPAKNQATEFSVD